MFKPLTLEQCTITVTAEQDDIPVRGNAMASGDDAFDKKVEDKILKRLARGEVWAWASVTVTVEFEDLSAYDHLGGCSYKNEKEFRRPGGYFDDMCQVALDDLNTKLEKIYNAVHDGQGRDV